MLSNTASFFSRKFRSVPTGADIQLVQQIITALKEITPPKTGQFSFSVIERKFVESLVQCLIDAYTHYRFAECGGVAYRAFRDSRTDWKRGALENGPQMAEARISRQYWLVFGERGRVDADARDRVLAEFDGQILKPLEIALHEGIAKGSRLDHLLSYLKSGIRIGVVYPNLQAVADAVRDASEAVDDLWCRQAGYSQ